MQSNGNLLSYLRNVSVQDSSVVGLVFFFFFFMSNGNDVRSQGLCILTVPRGFKCLVKGKRHITRNGKVVKCSIDQGLLCITSCHTWLDLPQTLADEQRPVDEHPVRRPIDLKVAEQHIGPEKGEDLINAVVRLIVRRHFGIGDIRRERGECVCGAARASPQRENGEVSCQRQQA